MNDLLATTIEAHGGLERWMQLNQVSARLVQGGALWALKGQAGVLDDVVVTASLHQERTSHHPFGAADRRSSFAPERVAILNGERSLRRSPRPTARLVCRAHARDDKDGGLLVRHDYDVEISGGTSAAHYVSDYDEVAGIRVPTRHRIFPRGPDGRSLAEPLVVSIDLSEIAFT